MGVSIHIPPAISASSPPPIRMRAAPIDAADAPFAPNACAVPVVPKHRQANRMAK